MRVLDNVLEKVCSQFHKVPESIVKKIVEAYQKELLESMLENGHTYVTPEIRVDIVPITPRRYVLRGQEYTSVRMYKLKASVVDNEFYDKLASEYDKLRDDFE